MRPLELLAMPVQVVELRAGLSLFLVAGPQAQGPPEPLAEAERLIRDLRISGTDENGLRAFVARYSGRGWQSLYEDLFGYDSLLQIREKMTRDSSFTEPTEVKSLRDRVCYWLRQKTEEHQKRRDHQHLATIEERGLAREGLSADEARDRAWQIAAAVMENTARPLLKIPYRLLGQNERPRRGQPVCHVFFQ